MSQTKAEPEERAAGKNETDREVDPQPRRTCPTPTQFFGYIPPQFVMISHDVDWRLDRRRFSDSSLTQSRSSQALPTPRHDEHACPLPTTTTPREQGAVTHQFSHSVPQLDTRSGTVPHRWPSPTGRVADQPLIRPGHLSISDCSVQFHSGTRSRALPAGGAYSDDRLIGGFP